MGEKHRIPSFLLVLLHLGFLFYLVKSRFVVEKNSLRVSLPDKIKGNYDTAIGNFGIPQYDGSMAGIVVYPKDNRKACNEFSDFSISFERKPGAMPTFVLLDRGGVCRYVIPKFHIQNSISVLSFCWKW